MEVLGLDVELPDGLQVEQVASGPEGVCIDIAGECAECLVSAIADQAVAAGFVEALREGGRIELERGEQRLILVVDSTGLTIQTYDPSGLPYAEFDGATAVLSDLRVDTGATSLEPRREQCLQGGRLRRASWRLCGVSAPAVVARVIDAAVQSRRLRRGAEFGPARGGRRIWTGEASSQLELVKARATEELEHVILEIELVDLRQAFDE